MQDGQNLFGPGSSWRVAESADAAIEAGEVEPLIIVGIANAGERRIAEYTPTNDWKMGGGEADKYGQLLVEELAPFIAANYRVRRGAGNTGLGGSSLGGLVTLYLGLKYDEIFGKLAVLSPSIWWNHRAILDIVSGTTLKARERPRIWLDVGDGEGRRPIADAELLARRLRVRGWRIGTDMSYERISGGTHDEAAWARRVRPMLRFLFPV
jgi:predicted alpha/beta superfamily hydrolase